MKTTACLGVAFGLPLLLASLIFSNDAQSIEAPAWPQECIALRAHTPERAEAHNYEVILDGNPGGWEAFCVDRSKTAVTVYQWASTFIDQPILGEVAMRHCRKEAWDVTGSSDPRKNLRLSRVDAWTNFETSGLSSLGEESQGLCDSTITAVRQLEGRYAYSREALSGQDPSSKTFANPCRRDRVLLSDRAALRTPWTEAMLPFDAIELFEATRFRKVPAAVARRTPETAATRTYALTSPNHRFALEFSRQTGKLLSKRGVEMEPFAFWNIETELEIVASDAIGEACPSPEKLDW